MLARFLALAALLVMLTQTVEAATKRDIDASASTAQFTVHHVFVETVTGTVPVSSGSVELPEGSLLPLRVAATLDPTHLHTGDDDRDGVLQTTDWFDTKKFPAWTFVSTAIAPESGNAFGVDGVLTVHGVASKVHLEVTVLGDSAHPRYHAVGVVDRRAFGMAKTRLDPVIGNDVALVIDARLK